MKKQDPRRMLGELNKIIEGNKKRIAELQAEERVKAEVKPISLSVKKRYQKAPKINRKK